MMPSPKPLLPSWRPSSPTPNLCTPSSTCYLYSLSLSAPSSPSIPRVCLLSGLMCSNWSSAGRMRSNYSMCKFCHKLDTFRFATLGLVRGSHRGRRGWGVGEWWLKFCLPICWGWGPRWDGGRWWWGVRVGGGIWDLEQIWDHQRWYFFRRYSSWELYI